MVSGSCACTSITNPKSVGRFPLTSRHESPASSERMTSQCFCMNSTPGREGCSAMRCTQCPTSAFGLGMYCDRKPRLIGRQLLPASSVRKAPAAEMATCIRRGLLGSSRIVCRHIPPAPGCHCGPVPWPRSPASSSQVLPPSLVWNSPASSTPAYTASGSVSDGSRCQTRLNSQGCCVPSYHWCVVSGLPVDVSPQTGKPLTTHQWYDGTQHPWEFKRVWHLEPSLTDPDTVYAGVEDAGLFRTSDGGKTWQELAGLRGHGTGPSWQPGAGGMCLHTILLDPSNARRMYVAISAAGAFRTDDAGKTWRPINRGLRSQYIPNPTAEVGHCVHRIALHRSRPGVLFMQKHWDVMRSDDAGDSWREVSGNLPTDFGFVIDVHAHEPETIYVVPIKSDSEHYVPDGKLRVYRSRKGGNEWEALAKGLPQQDCYVNVLRDAMAVDSLDPCGVYFGTSGGQVYMSADAGDNWTPIVRDLPAVLSVEVQTLR